MTPARLGHYFASARAGRVDAPVSGLPRFDRDCRDRVAQLAARFLSWHDLERAVPGQAQMCRCGWLAAECPYRLATREILGCAQPTPVH